MLPSPEVKYLENFFRGGWKTKGPQKIYIVPDNMGKTKYTDMWQDVIPNYLRGLGYIVEMFEPKVHTWVFGAGGDALYRSQQMEMFSSKIVTGSIKNGDIFIFQTIWNPVVFLLEQYRRTTNRKSIVTIGFWREDTVSMITTKQRYAKTDNPNIDYRRNEWAIHFSFSCMKACDFVIFDDASQRDKIHWAKSFKKIEWSRIKNYYGFPLSIGRNQITYPIEKENIILVPYSPTTHNEWYYLKLMRREFSDCQIVELSDSVNVTREVYINWLRRAKIVVNFSSRKQNFKNLYEPFLYRTHVFTHDKYRPADVLPEKYVFSRQMFKYTIPLMVYRHWVPLSERMRDVIDNYENHLPQIEEDEKLIGDTYFSANDFKKILTYLRREEPQPK